MTHLLLGSTVSRDCAGMQDWDVDGHIVCVLLSHMTSMYARLLV